MRENRQRYRDDTLILETEFICDGGAIRIVDFMPVSERCDVVRIVEGLEGEVPVEMLLDVRFGYGADKPLVTLARRRRPVHCGSRRTDPSRPGRVGAGW